MNPPDSPEWGFPNQATPVGSADYYAVRFSAAADRERNARLIAWYHRIQGIAAHTHDPGVARLKLDWWRAEAVRASAGEATHPLSIELAAHGVDGAALPFMLAIIDAADTRLQSPLPPDMDTFTRRCRNAMGQWFLLLDRFASPPADPEHCLDAGGYCAAVEALQRAGGDNPGLPAGYSPQRLHGLPAAQRKGHCEQLFAGFRVVAGGDHTAGLPELARKILALRLSLHNKMRRKGYPVGTRPIERPPIAHLWTAWRCR